ncbi:MAG TPA: 3-carboxy-cis,cis-muconate cycloisomerase [Terriglobales bacterium]|nr:3-carboxy-cis,cis-muconate cycloisomerase [Terriglobales bacterium]
MRLVDSLSTTARMAALFSDESILKAMLAFEVALARAEAGLGIIPKAAAAAIESAARPEFYDAETTASASLRSGTISIPFVKALTEQIRKIDSSAAGFVHWGATSQDVADTALVLLLKEAREILQTDLGRLEDSLRHLSKTYAATVMLSRTLLQAAVPTTFGLKVAGWLGAVRRDHARINDAFDQTLILQFGGAGGTLASLGNKGIAVGQALARKLSLSYPDAPWHTHRDRLAALMCSLGVLVGSLGKMARDISLLMQNEVAEVAEPIAEGRGGSSAMPHKQNPVGCTLALAAAYRVPGLVSTFLSSMVQEHERAAGGWQSEWPTISSIVQEAGLAVASMAEVAEGLTVNGDAMRANLDATRGTIFAERATVLLSEKLGREAASSLVDRAIEVSSTERRNFVNVLAAIPEVSIALEAATLQDLRSPEHYLGVAEQFRRNLLDEREFSKRLVDGHMPEKQASAQKKSTGSAAKKGNKS